MKDTNNEKKVESIKNNQQVTQGYLLHAIYGMIKEIKAKNKVTISKRGLRSLFAFGIVVVSINAYALVTILSEKNCEHKDLVSKLAIAEHERDKALTSNTKKEAAMATMARKIRRLESDKFALVAVIKDEPKYLVNRNFQPHLVTFPVKKVIVDNLQNAPKMQFEFNEFLTAIKCTELDSE